MGDVVPNPPGCGAGGTVGGLRCGGRGGREGRGGYSGRFRSGERGLFSEIWYNVLPEKIVENI